MEKNIVNCKGCGAGMFFEGGVPWYYKKVPILLEIDTSTFKRTSGYVSHFINCPKASQFSKAGEEK
jgi:hypothetical protein